MLTNLRSANPDLNLITGGLAQKCKPKPIRIHLNSVISVICLTDPSCHQSLKESYFAITSLNVCMYLCMYVGVFFGFGFWVAPPCSGLPSAFCTASQIFPPARRDVAQSLLKLLKISICLSLSLNSSVSKKEPNEPPPRDPREQRTNNCGYLGDPRSLLLARCLGRWWGSPRSSTAFALGHLYFI